MIRFAALPVVQSFSVLSTLITLLLCYLYYLLLTVLLHVFQQPAYAAIEKVKAPLPFAVSEIFWADVVSANCITFGDDVKKVYDLVLETKV